MTFFNDNKKEVLELCYINHPYHDNVCPSISLMILYIAYTTTMYTTVLYYSTKIKCLDI